MSVPANLAEWRSQRDALVEEDRSLRREFLLPPPSAIENKADEIVRRIQAEEAKTIWAADYEGVPHPFPGMEFLTGKRILETTKTFQILSKMPKGALLHAHLDATVDVEYLLKLALNQPAMHVRAPQRVTAANVTTTVPAFSGLPQNQFQLQGSVTDSFYEPGSWVQINAARESFDPALGGPAGFDQWVLGAMTINPSEAYGTHNTVTKIWQKFTSTFLGFTRFVPIFSDYLREFLRSSIADGISYVEPRINFVHKAMCGADGLNNVPHRELLLMFERVVNELKKEMKQQGRENEFVGAKIIYTTLKFIKADELDWYLDECIALKKEFPHLIAGFDLVGPEDSLKPLSYYMEPLLGFRERQAAAGVDIPLLLHAGETLGDGTEADMNLYDAIILDTKRIGHGFSLVKHPKLLEICRERDIALEVCPISNEILRLTSSMPMHPLPIVMNNGVPVALSSDDPSVFGSMGLTYDFYQGDKVLVSSEVTGLTTLGSLARDSLQYSMLEKEEKEVAMVNWEKRWNEYVGWIIREFEGPSNTE